MSGLNTQLTHDVSERHPLSLDRRDLRRKVLWGHMITELPTIHMNTAREECASWAVRYKGDRFFIVVSTLGRTMGRILHQARLSYLPETRSKPIPTSWIRPQQEVIDVFEDRLRWLTDSTTTTQRCSWRDHHTIDAYFEVNSPSLR